MSPRLAVLNNCALISLVLCGGVEAYTAPARWGQATAVIYDSLFVQGGKTDPSNQYTYTSANNNNDMLYLDLSNSFSGDSAPWSLISSSSNTSTPQGGPSLAWHTLSAYNNSQMLLFGGDPGPNSAPPIVTQPDSAALVDVFDRLVPNWIAESSGWANEPMRRIHHSTASIGGKIYIIGGTKDDGSNTVFSDHYVFDPSVPSFSQLTATNGPADIAGHASLVLTDGRIIVFGGYSQSMSGLVPFSTVWVYDPSTSSWSSVSVSGSSLPSPRRAFAATILQDGKILIHGGCDATFGTTYSDGWILDTSQNPMPWTAVSALSQLGPRRDHFAVSYGSQVIFGFGYGASAPASASLSIYDTGSGSFTSTYTPPDSSSGGGGDGNGNGDGSGDGGGGNGSGNGNGNGSGGGGGNGNGGGSGSAPAPTTLPGPVPTSGSGGNNGVSGSAGGSATGTSSGVHPTATDGGGSGNDSSASKKHTTAIALGTVFGILGLVAGGVAASVYLSRRDRPLSARNRFSLLHGGRGTDDEENSPHGHLPVAHGAFEKMDQRASSNWFPRSLGRSGGAGAAAGIAAASRAPRRDMLADEDTREFGQDSRFYNVRRDGSGSTWSLGAIGARLGLRSREPSGSSVVTPWREKNDPFLDNAAPLIGEGMAPLRPYARRDLSYATYASTLDSAPSYHDPFGDDEGIQEVHRYEDGSESGQSETSERRPLHPGSLQTVLPLSTGVHTLSPLTEQTSRPSLMDPTASGSSNNHATDSSRSSREHALSPFDPVSRGTSYTSHHPDSPSAATQRTSIIGGSSAPSQPMRRSDSWWQRFSRTSLLDRRASAAGPPHARMLDFRDPNPPPRLVAIEESMHSQSPESPESGGATGRKDSRGKRLQGAHGRSMSSLRTQQTADSEAIEKMAEMDVQRDGSRSTRASQATGPSSGRSSPISRANSVQVPPLPPPPAYAPVQVQSPTAVDRPSSGGKVASRVQELERKMSQDAEAGAPLSPTERSTRQREQRQSKRTSQYGLVPRPSLYVANPDHSQSPSSASTTG